MKAIFGVKPEGGQRNPVPGDVGLNQGGAWTEVVMRETVRSGCAWLWIESGAGRCGPGMGVGWEREGS